MRLLGKVVFILIISQLRLVGSRGREDTYMIILPEGGIVVVGDVVSIVKLAVMD
jgi:hypothetical protein